jgi:NAD(P)-dependent dehydrogenase (short-subunit alcohol dehydrogenase family)
MRVMERGEIKAPPHRSLPDRAVALVTGGANGIGLEVVRQLHRGGVRVVAVDLDAEALTSLEASGVTTYHADVRQGARMDEILDDVVERFGAVNLVAPLAGLFLATPWATTSADAARLSVDVNLVHPMTTALGALGLARRRGFWCEFVFAGSDSSVYLPAGLGPYSTAKAGLAAFAVSLARDLADDPRFGVTLGLIPPTRTRFAPRSSAIANRLLPVGARTNGQAKVDTVMHEAELPGVIAERLIAAVSSSEVVCNLQPSRRAPLQRGVRRLLEPAVRRMPALPRALLHGW